MVEKFNLTWNDFQSNITKSFKSLREESDLFDVTLISSDHRSVPAHKVVLSACSEFFKTIFNKNNSANMSLYLDCATFKEINLVLDYIYQGEVQLYQEELEGFLGVAENLKLDGLLSNGETEKEPVSQEDKVHTTKKIHKLTTEKYYPSVASKQDERSLSTLNQSVQCSNAQVEEKFQELVLKEDKLFRCTVCNKTMPHRTNMKKHLETHLSGLSYECPLCGKTYRTEKALLDHKRNRCAKKV